MAKLSEKQRAEAKDLLGDYQTICDMIHDANRRQFAISIQSTTDKDDFEEVQVRRQPAKELLEAEKKWTEDELKKLGIEV
jgi:hypothetical protein